jgi:methionyl-tRNA synthetase
MRLASEVNKYLDTTAPWFEIRSDRAAAGKSIYTSLKAIDSLKLLLAPFLPFSSERLHGYFGYSTPLFGQSYTQVVHDTLGDHTVLRYRAQAGLMWKPSSLLPGQKLNPPAPLFKKLEEALVEQERARLGT